MSKPTPKIYRDVSMADFAVATGMAEGRPWVLDTETDGLMVRGAMSKHKAHWIGLTPVGTSVCFIWDRQTFEREHIRKVMAGLDLIGHNLRFDLQALDLVPGPGWQDTMLHLAHVCSSQGLKLDDQAKVYGWDKIKTDKMLMSSKPWQTNRITEMCEEKLCEYLWDDCVFTSVLWQKIQKSTWADKDKATEDAARRMEARGVRLHLDGLAAFEKAALDELEKARGVLDAHGFEGGNYNSPIQVGRWLHNRGIPLKKNPKTKNWKTDKVSLGKLDHLPEIDSLFKVRTAHKLGIGLVELLRNFQRPDGCIYPSVRTTGARTGRFSYSDPPLQQIPIRNKRLGPLARKMFSSRGGYTAGADFSQVELRVIAALSNEPVLLEAFASGRDPHAETAAGMFGVPIGSIFEGDPRRHAAKEINFGIPNGMKEKRLGLALNCSTGEAIQYLKAHKAAMPDMHGWMEETWENGRKFRVVSNLSGRTRAFTGKESTLPSVSQKMQGTAAELMREALVAVDAAGAEPIMSVHDEIITENVWLDGVDVARIMRDAANSLFPDELGAVDFLADGGQGFCWGDVH